MQSARSRGKFKGPPWAPEWIFGSVGRSNALSGESAGRQVNVHMQRDNRARPRFHTVSSVKGKVVGSNVKCKVQSAKAHKMKCECHEYAVGVKYGLPTAECKT